MGLPSYQPAPGTMPPPGTTLLEWLETNQRSQVWLAHQLQVSTKHINRIIKGRTRYSAELALRLGVVTGLQAQFWMRLQADYEVNQAEVHFR